MSTKSLRQYSEYPGSPNLTIAVHSVKQFLQSAAEMLHYPQIDNIDLWDKIVSHKHQPTKNQLLRIRDKVVARYNYYSEHYDTLDEILPLPSEEWSGVKDALISCYGDNVEFKRVRQQQFSSLSATDKTKCPYCLLSRPSTLDHYFDKNDYPEFSVFIPNLVPCCSECNNIKSTTTFDVNNNRVFLHFYHDHIPEEQFLFVRFSGTNPDAVPVISIGLRFGEENYYSSLLQRHFTKLSHFQISKRHSRSYSPNS